MLTTVIFLVELKRDGITDAEIDIVWLVLQLAIKTNYNFGIVAIGRRW
jgi:hypothetical protein